MPFSKGISAKWTEKTEFEPDTPISLSLAFTLSVDDME